MEENKLVERFEREINLVITQACGRQKARNTEIKRGEEMNKILRKDEERENAENVGKETARRKKKSRHARSGICAPLYTQKRDKRGTLLLRFF